MQKKSDDKKSNSLKSLKERNRKQVLGALRGAGPLSISQISKSTGLSKMTVHKIIDYYLEEALVVAAGKGDSTDEGGKKPNLFAFNANSRYIFAVHLGGDFLASSIVNLDGRPLVKGRRVSIVDASFDEVVKMIGDEFVRQAASKCLEHSDCFATVVGCNGVVDSDRGVCLTNYQYPHWGENVPLRDCLAPFLPQNIPVHVDSWWRHLAHGEAHSGSASGDRDFFLIGNSGNCVSGGMVADGKAFRGATGFAGEVGHMIVAPKSASRCICGGYGCLEVMVAPIVVAQRAKEQFDAYPDSPIFGGNATGDVVGGLRGIGEAADAGDELSRRLLGQVAEHFAIAINNIIILCDPGRVVFFGDYARCGGYFLAELRRRAGGMTMHGIDKRTEIDVSPLGDDYGVSGAARHVTDRLFR